MAEISRLEAQVEINSPAEKFYGFFRNKMHHLVQMFPKNVKSFQLLEGDEIRAGCLTHWKYDLGETNQCMPFLYTMLFYLFIRDNFINL